MKKTEIQNQKSKEIFDYLVKESIEIVESGKELDSRVYVIIADDKKVVSLLPIPLTDTADSSERQAILSHTGTLLKEKKFKVKMFLSILNAYGTKKDNIRPSEDSDRIEMLIANAITITNERTHRAYRVDRSGTQVKTVDLLKTDDKEWKFDAGSVKTEDRLLETILTAYKKKA